MDIRYAELNDLIKIVKIYNQAIELKTTADDSKIIKVEEKIDWFYNHYMDKHPIYVLELNNEIAGWISLSPYRINSDALKYTAEMDCYVHNDHKRKGIGRKMVNYVIENCPTLKIKTILAVILEDNTAAMNLFKSCNFQRWAYIPEVLKTDNSFLGHIYYGIKIKE